MEKPKPRRRHLLVKVEDQLSRNVLSAVRAPFPLVVESFILRPLYRCIFDYTKTSSNHIRRVSHDLLTKSTWGPPLPVTDERSHSSQNDPRTISHYYASERVSTTALDSLAERRTFGSALLGLEGPARKAATQLEPNLRLRRPMAGSLDVFKTRARALCNTLCARLESAIQRIAPNWLPHRCRGNRGCDGSSRQNVNVPDFDLLGLPSRNDREIVCPARDDSQCRDRRGYTSGSPYGARLGRIQ